MWVQVLLQLLTDNIPVGCTAGMSNMRHWVSTDEPVLDILPFNVLLSLLLLLLLRLLTRWIS